MQLRRRRRRRRNVWPTSGKKNKQASNGRKMEDM
jgi:hypothetical protein